MKKLLIALLMITVAFAVFAGGGKESAAPETEAAPAAPVIKNADTFVYVSYGTIESLDPGRGYDNATDAIIQNIYDSLIEFDGSATDKFTPALVTEVPTKANGGISADGKVYTFKIKKGVKFHSGNELTAEDVEYSLRRYLVQDTDSGPIWMHYFAYFGTYSSRDGEGNISANWDGITSAVKRDGNNVIVTLKNQFPPFLAMMAGTWGSIVDKQFVSDNGGWDGTEATWKDYNNPANGQETLLEIASGTGPYKLERWEKGVEVVMTRNEAYWGKKPAMKTAIYKFVDEWSTRKLMLLQGDADSITVDSIYWDEMDQEEGIYSVKDLPELGVRAINYNQKITATDNPLLYSGKLDGAGIPSDFFSDKDVRLGFTYAWDQETFLRDILGAGGRDVATPHVAGLPYRDESLERLPFDLKKAEEHLKKAWGGKLWEKGFELDIMYNQGNEIRESGMKLFAEVLMSLNPKFKIHTRGVEWASYVQAIRARTLPMFFVGWGADYPHPDNFMSTYMHSEGPYGGRCSYNNPEADRLLEAGAIEADPVKAAEIYSAVAKIWLEDVPGFTQYQPVKRQYFKDWVKGYIPHPMENEFEYSMFTKEY